MDGTELKQVWILIDNIREEENGIPVFLGKCDFLKSVLRCDNDSFIGQYPDLSILLPV